MIFSVTFYLLTLFDAHALRTKHVGVNLFSASNFKWHQKSFTAYLKKKIQCAIKLICISSLISTMMQIQMTSALTLSLVQNLCALCSVTPWSLCKIYARCRIHSPPKRTAGTKKLLSKKKKLKLFFFQWPQTTTTNNTRCRQLQPLFVLVDSHLDFRHFRNFTLRNESVLLVDEHPLSIFT